MADDDPEAGGIDAHAVDRAGVSTLDLDFAGAAVLYDVLLGCLPQVLCLEEVGLALVVEDGVGPHLVIGLALEFSRPVFDRAQSVG